MEPEEILKDLIKYLQTRREELNKNPISYGIVPYLEGQQDFCDEIMEWLEGQLTF